MFNVTIVYSFLKSGLKSWLNALLRYLLLLQFHDLRCDYFLVPISWERHIFSATPSWCYIQSSSLENIANLWQDAYVESRTWSRLSWTSSTTDIVTSHWTAWLCWSDWVEREGSGESCSYDVGKHHHIRRPCAGILPLVRFSVEAVCTLRFQKTWVRREPTVARHEPCEFARWSSFLVQCGTERCMCTRNHSEYWRDWCLQRAPSVSCVKMMRIVACVDR